MLATAPPARRVLLVEVPGPWGRAGLTSARLDPGVTRPLAAAADAAGVRVQLIRRPGRHAAPRRPHPIGEQGSHAWALADPYAGVVRWGRWRSEHDLRGIDLTAPFDPARDAATGEQRLALVCTHARHDVCCAVRGRPVAAAVAVELDRQTWETSHLGGDRFAANLLLLPEGEVFGGLDVDSALEVARRLDDGRLTLPHYRGRIGRSPVHQAALHLAAAELGDDRIGVMRVLGTPRRDAEGWLVRIAHGEQRYVVRLQEWWAPAHRLTCAALEASPSRRFAVRSLAIDTEGVRRAG
jgi:hypothetical protein